MRGAMGTRYEYLNDRATVVDPVPGHSNYFSEPQDEHDPRLFEPGSNIVREDIRLELWGALLDFLGMRYAAPESWVSAWIAGSALGSQWSVDATGKGDLDILVGVDISEFFYRNPSFRAFPEETIARHMNTEFREQLWPAYADYRNGQFEVTFYVNPKTGRDIRNINPYAAYNLATGEWDVEPPSIGEDWSEEAVPEEWRRAVMAEVSQAKALIERYNHLVTVLDRTSGPGRVTTLREVGLVMDQITALYEDVHAQRRMAFQGRFGVQGEGFFDFYNYRWQLHKKYGTGPTMNEIRRLGRSVTEEYEIAKYGVPPAKDVLTPATLKDYL